MSPSTTSPISKPAFEESGLPAMAETFAIISNDDHDEEVYDRVEGGLFNQERYRKKQLLELSPTNSNEVTMMSTYCGA